MKAPDWRSRVSNPNTSPAPAKQGGTPNRPKATFRTVGTKAPDHQGCNLGAYNNRRAAVKKR